MPAVSNTSPVSNLAVIGRLGSLHRQLGEILIPSAVRAELARLEDPSATRAIDTALSEQWLKVVALRDQSLSRALQGTLDSGEAEAIALAVETRAELLVMDETAGRAAARSQHIPLTGTLGILLLEKLTGHIPSLAEEIDRLTHDAGFFISATIRDQFLAEAGEIGG